MLSAMERHLKTLEIFKSTAELPGTTFRRFKYRDGPQTISDTEDESLWEPSTKEETLKRLEEAINEARQRLRESSPQCSQAPEEKSVVCLCFQRDYF